MIVVPFNSRRDDLPVTDIRIGPAQRIKIYGFADLSPPLVELWVCEPVHLTVAQADAIANGLVTAPHATTYFPVTSYGCGTLRLQAEGANLARRSRPKRLDVECRDFRIADLLSHPLPHRADRCSALHHAGTRREGGRIFGVELCATPCCPGSHIAAGDPVAFIPPPLLELPG
jgi:hypothetical protein